MLEARTFVENLDEAKRILAENNAVFMGEYEIHNIIYASKDQTKSLGQIFLRLRTIPKNIWNEKPVIVVIKETELKEVGKNSIIPLKREFNTKEEALGFINKNYDDQFEYSFEFGCIGWQYFIGEDGIDLENIEGHASIEFKSTTIGGLNNLLALFHVTETIKGPSVVAVKEILNR